MDSKVPVVKRCLHMLTDASAAMHCHTADKVCRPLLRQPSLKILVKTTLLLVEAVMAYLGSTRITYA